MKNTSKVNLISGVEGILRAIYSFLPNLSTKAQVKSVMSIVEQSNSIILKALVDPRPLLAMQPPESYSMGSSEEAYFVITAAISAWADNPKALVYLEKLIGGDAHYDVESTSMHKGYTRFGK